MSYVTEMNAAGVNVIGRGKAWLDDASPREVPLRIAGQREPRTWAEAVVQLMEEGK